MKDIPMKNPLKISAKCKGNDQCLFDGSDMFLYISIINTEQVSIGFPLEFVQKTGPGIRLIDKRTKADAYLKTNLADFALREKFAMIQPGDSLILKWVIKSSELEQFGGPRVDLSAEITVAATILMNGEKVAFTGADRLQIVSKDKH
jgi:hypothetical protein